MITAENKRATANNLTIRPSSPSRNVRSLRLVMCFASRLMSSCRAPREYSPRLDGLSFRARTRNTAVQPEEGTSRGAGIAGLKNLAEMDGLENSDRQSQPIAPSREIRAAVRQ